MYKSIIPVILLFGISAQADTQDATCKQEPASAVESAIQKTVKSYTSAFNRGDAKALAAHWTETGEFRTPAGELLQGRDALEKNFVQYFKEVKSAKIEVDTDFVQLLSPGVAIEEGTVRVIRPDAEINNTKYSAVHVKTDAGWKLDSVKEQQVVQPQSHYEQLKSLEWLIGSWVDADGSGSVETTCSWTKNRNFITRSFRVHVKDRVTMEGTQIIGWDPLRKTVRSWMFDSAGGFGVGAWTQNNDVWTFRTLQVLANGEKATSINILKKIDDNSYSFRSVGREVDGELLPNIEEVQVVRK